MNLRMGGKFRKIIRRVQSVPAFIFVILLFPFIFFMISEWDDLFHYSILIYLSVCLSVLVVSMLFLPLTLRTHRRKTVTGLLAGHYCAHCGYSLRNLPCSDGLTSCPECGVVWRLPELVEKPPVKWYYFRIVMMTFMILVYMLFTALSIVHGKPVLSSENITNILLIISYSFITYYSLIRNGKFNTHLVMGSYHELDRGHCPACHVVLDGVPVDWDGVTTCAECGAVWRVADAEMECEIFKPTKFSRKYLVPTRVVDGKGKLVMMLRPRNDWNAFIIQSLIKKQCPGCLCSLSGLEVDDDGMTRCPECEAVWVLPGKGDV